MSDLTTESKKPVSVYPHKINISVIKLAVVHFLRVTTKWSLESLIFNYPFELSGRSRIRAQIKAIEIIKEKFQRQSQRRSRYTVHSILRQIVATHSFYFMLCQSYLLSAVISFVYKDKLWFDESMSVIFCMENT